ncbi:hypothetical protein EDD17DRAFT_1579581 [Pisolithus thermaeus]|nr:hypothetical protein EDD17DRAFT_1579581 [Pisolithus thermaeus]
MLVALSQSTLTTAVAIVVHSPSFCQAYWVIGARTPGHAASRGHCLIPLYTPWHSARRTLTVNRHGLPLPQGLRND